MAEKLPSFIRPNRVQPQIGRVVIVTASNPGSLGDEAMLCALCTALLERKKEIYVLSPEAGWQTLLDEYGISAKEVVVTKAFRRPTSLFGFRNLIEKLRPETFYVIGADVIDGYYSEVASMMRLGMLQMASHCCASGRLVGFSFNENPSRIVCKKIQELKGGNIKFCARDPLSAERVRNLGVSATLAADLAFLLKPKAADEKLEVCLGKVHGSREIGGSAIALNINSHHFRMEGRKFLDKVKFAIQKLVSEKDIVVFVAHDTRSFEGECDYSLGFSMAQELTEAGVNCVVAPQGLLASEVKFLAAQMDFVLTGRMHFAIAGLSQGIPTAMYSYQGKQKGLLQHLSLSPETWLIDYKAHEQSMALAVSGAFKQRRQAAQTIREALPEVKALALLNIGE